MTITTRTEVTGRNFKADGQMEVVVETVVETDGVETGRMNKTGTTIEPGEDVTAAPAEKAQIMQLPEVARLIAAEHTPEVVARFRANRAAAEG